MPGYLPAAVLTKLLCPVAKFVCTRISKEIHHCSLSSTVIVPTSKVDCGYSVDHTPTYAHMPRQAGGEGGGSGGGAGLGDGNGTQVHAEPGAPKSRRPPPSFFADVRLVDSSRRIEPTSGRRRVFA